MLNLQFLGLNLYFAANLLAALACFAVFWLIFDAWTARHNRVELIKWGGFLALSVGFLIHGAALRTGSGTMDWLTPLAQALRLFGYLGIVAGQILDPLQHRPQYDLPGEAKSADRSKSLGVLGPLMGPVVGLALPLAAAAACALYLRRATVGLERHLRPVAVGFAVLSLFELLGDITRLDATVNPSLYQLVAPYGPVWWLALATLTIGALILILWVWQYLTKRLQSQLFMILVTQTLGLFLVSTIAFTYLMLQNMRTASLADLTTASNVLRATVASRQDETAAQAAAVAASSTVANAAASSDHRALITPLSGYLQAHRLASLVVTNNSGQILFRGDDPGRWGDSASSDPLVRRSLVGQTSSGVVVTSGVVAPNVTLVAAGPIRDNAGDIVGTVTAGRAVDTAFVDGLHASTGMDIAVYGGDVRAATTLIAPDGTSRAIGTKETSAAVNQQVLAAGRSFSSEVTIQNRAYLAAFAPLKDSTGVTVGMLLAARPADTLFSAADHSIQITYMLVVILIIASIFPIFLIARYLARQLK